jgi:hypothetical protein
MSYRAFIPCVVMAATAAYGQSAQTRAENFCAGLTAMSADLAQLQALRSDATTGELNTIIDRVEKDIRLVEQDVANSSSPASKQFMVSSEALLVNARAVPQGMAMDQVKARMQDDLDSVQHSKQALARESHCGTAMLGQPGSALGPEHENSSE